jgi:hypothetical protein
MLSVISLPGIKALWELEMITGNTPLSLLAKTLEIILYKTLQRLIGRKSVTQTGLGTFGIKAILIALIFSSKKPV